MKSISTESIMPKLQGVVCAGFVFAMSLGAVSPAFAGRQVHGGDVARIFTGKAFRIECDGTTGRGQISEHGVANVSYRRPSDQREERECRTWAGAHCPLGALSVSHIVLLTLDVGLHVGRRHQSHCMTKFLEFASPMVRRGVSLDCNQTRWKLLEERQHGATLRLAADDHLASSINFVHLKHRLGD